MVTPPSRLHPKLGKVTGSATVRSSVRPLPQANQSAPLHARNSAYQQFPLLLAAVSVGAGSFWPVLSMLRLPHLSLVCGPSGFAVAMYPCPVEEAAGRANDTW